MQQVATTRPSNPNKDRLDKNERASSTRQQNVNAAKAVADAIRTSLGPRGMDKMIQDSKGGVVITNDGATILKEMNVAHPSAKLLVELSEAQDIEAGDGTTSVVVICGAFLEAASDLLEKGLHPQVIAREFIRANDMAQKILGDMAVPVDITNRSEIEKAVTTSLQSKVVSSLASCLAPIATEAVCAVCDPVKDCNVDLRNVRVVKQLGGTIDDSELVRGLVLANQKVSRLAGGPLSAKDAKIGLIQFHLSLPKTDMDQQVTIKDYAAMDRLLKQERIHISKMVKQIAKTGCNVLLVQKSILREPCNELALDFLAKAKILVIRDIEREDIDQISKSLGCEPIASIDDFVPERLGHADCVAEEVYGSSRIVKFTGVKATNSISVAIRASNVLTLDESERSFRDAACVVRSLIRKKALLPGGGAPEMEVASRLLQESITLGGVTEMCVAAYARALEVIPYTLAENAGLKPIEIVTDLRNKHNQGKKNAGVDIKRGCCTDDMMADLNIVQPLLVSSSALSLATETVVLLLRIDDIVLCR